MIGSRQFIGSVEADLSLEGTFVAFRRGQIALEHTGRTHGQQQAPCTHSVTLETTDCATRDLEYACRKPLHRRP
jgi:hypothetical protein